MRKAFGSFSALAVSATAAFLLALTPSAFANPTITANTATSCTAGASTSGVGTICVGDTTPYSLTALVNGTQTLKATVNGHDATYLVVNDTGNSSFTLTYTGVTQENGEALICTNSLSGGICELTGPLGTVGGASANYGPPSGGTWTSAPTVQLTVVGIPTASGSKFDIAFSNFIEYNSSGSLSGACYAGATGSSCSVQSCPAGQTTTVTGVVYMPNGLDPLPGALIYIPSTQPTAIPAGVECLPNGDQATGNPLVSAYSNYDGTFTLTGSIPAGTNIPIVIQSGKWRMQGTINTVTACSGNTAPAWATTMPQNHIMGDMPKIAIVTGSVDGIECVLRQTGIADSEFTDPGGTGQINLYKGAGSGGAVIDGSTPSETTLTGSSSTMSAYDMIMFPCQGSEFDQNATALANITQWNNQGGRLFTTHFSYAYLFNSLNAASVDQEPGIGTVSLDNTQGPKTAVKWHVKQAQPTPDPGEATVNTSFTGGATESSWLELPTNPGASTTPEGSAAQIALNTLRLDQDGVVPPTQAWLTLNANNTTSDSAAPWVMQLTFNTPVGASGLPGQAQQCGKVLYNDYHVTNGSFSGNFPSECSSITSFTPQQHLVEYALFYLTGAVTQITNATVAQTFVNNPTPAFTQGDTADTVTINVQNNGTIPLTSTLEVTGTFPTGITVNTSTFTSGGWTCTTGGSPAGTTFDCKRTTPLAPGDTDAIVIPVQVASDAPTSPTGSLTDTIMNGGLSTNVTGSDSLPIVGKPVITWTPNPEANIVYGAALSTQLNASATCGGATVPGTYVYKTGSTTLTSSTVLAPGTYPLGVTFTPDTITSSCPVQTATNSITVTQPAEAITWTPNPEASIVYPAPLSTQLNAVATYGGVTVPGTYVYKTGSTTLTSSSVLAPGTYPLTVTFTPTDTNLSPQITTNSITVTQPAKAITWTPNPEVAINYGTPLGSTQLAAVATYGGVQVPGNYVYTTGSTVLNTGTVLNAGTYPLSVTFTPTDTNLPPQTTTNSIVVNQLPQTITFNPATPLTYPVASPVTLTATGGASGNPVTFTYISGPGSLSGPNNDTLTVTAPGNIVVKACQAGNTNYSAATCVTKTIVVNQPAEAITWTPNPETSIVYPAPLATQLNAVATYGGVTVPGTYVYTTGSTTLTPASVLAPGTYPLSVTFTPTDTNLSPQTTTNSITVTQPAKAITWTPNPESPITYGAPLSTQLNAVATYGGSTVPGVYSYSTGSTPISASTVLNASTTPYPLSVTFTPTDTNLPAQTTTNSILVNPQPQVITFNPPATEPYGSAPITLTATGGASGNPVTFTYISGPGTLSGPNNSTLTFTGAGPVVVEACQAGSTPPSINYSAATCVTRTITVPQPTEAITWTPNPELPITYGAPLSSQLNAVATYGGSTVPGTYTYTTGSMPISASTVLNASTTPYPLSVTFTPTDSTLPAQTTTNSILVNPQPQVITFNPPATEPYGSAPITLTATGGASGNPVTFTYISGPGTLSGPNNSTLTFTGAGPVVVEACQAGSTPPSINYSAATCVTKTINVTQPAKAITWTPNPQAPISYGTPISATQLNAVATYGGVQVPGTYTYTTGATVLSPGTILNAGTYPLSVTFTPTDTTLPAQTTTNSLTVNPDPTGTKITTASKPVVNQPDTLSATVTTTPTGGTPSGTVTFTSGGNTLCTATLNANGVGTCTFTPTVTGNETITASYTPTGDPNHLPSLGTATINVCALLPQTITFTGLPATTTYSPNQQYTLTGTASSGLPVSYTVTGPATVSGSTLTITGPGIVTVTASQGGNSTYGAANPVSQTIVVSQAPTVTTLTPASKTPSVGSPDVLTATVTGAGKPTGTVAFTAAGSPIAGCTAVTLSAAGTATCSYTPTATGPVALTASYSGNTNNAPSSGASTVYPATTKTQTITFTLPATATYSTGLSYTLTATASSGLPVTYAVTGPGTIAESVLTITGAGSVTVTASQAGNAKYLAATPVARTIVVSQAPTVTTLVSASTSPATGQPDVLTSTVSGAGGPTGTVVYTAGSTTICTVTIVGGLVPTCTYTPSAAGTVVLTATYQGDTNNLTSSATTKVYPKTPTAQTITFTLPATGQYSTGLSYTLTGTASSGLPVTYTVTGPATISGNVLSITGAGSVAVTASQAGNSKYSAATPVVRTIVISPAATNTVLTAATTTPGAGTPDLLTAMVSGVGSPTGTVTFSNGAIVICANVPLVAGVASCSYTPATSSAAIVTATYSGDPNNATSAGNLVLNQAKGQSIIFPPLTPNPATYTSGLTYTLNAVATSGLPIAYAVTGPGTVSGNILTITGPGTVTVTASQAGNPTCGCGSAKPVSQSVVIVAPTLNVVLTDSPTSDVVGQPDQLTATITGGVNPTGTVTFTAGGVTLCTGTVNTRGVATCSFTPTSTGNLVITANYKGDSTNPATSSAPVTLPVTKAPTTLPLTAVTNSPVVGQPDLLTATVTGGYNPTGTVAFTIGGVTIPGCGAVPVGAGGVATCSYTPTSNGPVTVTATYGGDTNNLGSSSTLGLNTSSLLPTQMEVACWNSTFAYGANYQCYANSDLGPLSGYIVYTLDGGAPVQLTLNPSNGSVSFSIVLPPAGNHTLIITYPQQGNQQAYTLPTQTFTVTPAPVNVAFNPSAWYAKVGTTITLSAAVTSWSAGPPNGIGTVSFFDGATLLATVPVNASGVASYTTSSFTIGYHNITETYSGTANYASGSVTGTIQIGQY
jgi:hypothetical protein